ncbi:MAG: hypothetical protein ACE5H4_01175 [Candidatus Thorarchaeota archaeon]
MYLVDSITQEREEFGVHKYYNFMDSDLGTVWDGERFWTHYYSQFVVSQSPQSTKPALWEETI